MTIERPRVLDGHVAQDSIQWCENRYRREKGNPRLGVEKCDRRLKKKDLIRARGKIPVNTRDKKEDCATMRLEQGREKANRRGKKE